MDLWASWPREKIKKRNIQYKSKTNEHLTLSYVNFLQERPPVPQNFSNLKPFSAIAFRQKLFWLKICLRLKGLKTLIGNLLICAMNERKEIKESGCGVYALLPKKDERYRKKEGCTSRTKVALIFTIMEIKLT